MECKNVREFRNNNYFYATKEDARKSLLSLIRHGLLEVSGKGKVIELEVLVYD